MKSPRLDYFNIGTRLKLTFAGLILLIVGGNGLLIRQFRIARLQTDRLTSVSQQLIAVLRFQEILLSFHQRLDEPARAKDATLLVSEAEPLRSTLFEQTRRTRNVLSQLPPGTRVDPALLPTLEAIEITLPRQIEAVAELAKLGDWGAVRLRLSNELTSFETESSVLVNDIDQDVNEELAGSVGEMESVQRRILIIVPTTALCTFLTATFFGWAITRRMIELRMQERVGERTRIARELHDTFIQTIQGSKLVADDALDNPNDAFRMRHAVEQLSVWLGQAAQEGRAALNSLRTSTIERNDLAEAFQRVIDECQIQTPMEATFSVIGTSREMHPIVRDEVYRIGYEAIRNASTHSRGSRLDVELTYARDLTVRVSDNGIGIDQEIADKGRDGHFGMQGMRERAFRIGGQLKFTSSPKSGTSVELKVPGRIVFHRSTPAWWARLTKIKKS